MKRKKIQELGIANNFDGIVVTKNIKSDSLMEWGNVYFLHAVTTSPNSQREQKRDLQLFISFMDKEDGSGVDVTFEDGEEEEWSIEEYNTIADQGRIPVGGVGFKFVNIRLINLACLVDCYCYYIVIRSYHASQST